MENGLELDAICRCAEALLFLFLTVERFQYDSLKQENILILIVYLP